MSQKAPRNLALDMTKGLMILWVPAVHLIRWDLVPEVVTHILQTFFSAIMLSFFILSGYVYKPGKRSWAESVKHRTVQLLKPFVFWTIAVLVFDGIWMAFSGNLNTVSDALLPWLRSILSSQTIEVFTTEEVTPIYMLMHGQMVAFWFIGSMILSSLIFFAAAPLVNKSAWGTVVLSVSLLLLSGWLRVVIMDDLPFALQELPAWAAAMLLGCLAGKLKLFEKCPLSKPAFFISCIPLLAALWFLYPLTGSGQQLGDFIIWHPLAKTVMSLMQLYIMVFAFGMMKSTNRVGRFFGWVGQNTMTILLCHMLFGTLISLITGLYCLSTVLILSPGADMYSAPGNAVLQGILLWTITTALCLLLCFGKERLRRTLSQRENSH